MIDQEKTQANAFPDRIELAVGERQWRDGPNAVLVAEILQAIKSTAVMGLSRPSRKGRA
jgi:hypothetical protein